MALPSTQARQILLNLLLNAVKAIGERGKIECNVRQDRKHLRITVENDGAPIPTEKADHLFEPFSGAEPNATGLGLWVTYQNVQQFRGEIMVDSHPGHTRFRVELPVTG